MSKGFSLTKDLLDELNDDIFSPMKEDADDMFTFATGGATECENAQQSTSCGQTTGFDTSLFDGLKSYFDIMASAATTIGDLVDSVPDALDEAKGGLDVGSATIESGAWAVYAFFLIISLSYIPDMILEVLAESQLKCDIACCIRCMIDVKVIISWFVDQKYCY